MPQGSPDLRQMLCGAGPHRRPGSLLTLSEGLSLGDSQPPPHPKKGQGSGHQICAPHPPSFSSHFIFPFLFYNILEKFMLFVVQSLSRVWFFVIPWTAARQASMSFTISQSLLKLMSIELVMLSKHLILCHPLLLLLSIFPSIRVFSFFESASILWYIYRLQYSTFSLFYISLFWGSRKIYQPLIYHSMEVILFGNCWTIEEKQIKVK